MNAEAWTAIAAFLALAVSAATLAISMSQQYRFAGAMAAIAWREQVLDLHDRGLSAEQIRRIMLLEKGGSGYEESNGQIDEILREVPSPSGHDRR